MDTLSAIGARRSIRKFQDREIPREVVEQILQAGANAPSAKNRQPWRFVVVTARERAGMLDAMREGVAWMAANSLEIGSSQYTIDVMAQAPATVFVINPEGKAPSEGLAPYGDRFLEMVDIQSVGAAIQNMCLAATSLGLGSLWICDVFSAYDQLMQWLGMQGQLVAAVSIGYPLESPAARPRKKLEALTTWR